MSDNTENYTEQGGDTTVIGGTLEIKEGAQVKGLPASYILVDCGGVLLEEMLAGPVDITKAISVKEFQNICKTPLPKVVTGLHQGNKDHHFHMQCVCNSESDMVGAAWLVNGSTAAMTTLFSAYIYVENKRVFIRAHMKELT